MPTRKPNHTKKQPTAAKGRKDLRVVVRGEQHQNINVQDMVSAVVMLAHELKLEADGKAKNAKGKAK